MTADDGATLQPTARRVLVVDDDELNRRTAAALCARLGLEVDEVADGRGALALLAERPFDLVLLDDRMPGLDGTGVAREVRHREAAAGLGPVPIIALTASILPEDRERLLAAGMDDGLAKPLLVGELAAAVERLLPRDRPPRVTAIPSSPASA